MNTSARIVEQTTGSKSIDFAQAVRSIEKIGYCRLPGVYSKERAAEALGKVKYWYERCKDQVSKDVPFLNRGQPTLYNLQNKDYFFLEFLFEPKIMQDLLIHFLNDKWFKQIPQDLPNYLLRTYIARSSNNELPMHIDSFVPYSGDYPFVMQYSIILQDQNEENGCTLVVPGSHLTGEYASQEDRSRAVAIESEAGDVVIWDSRLWHGTTANQTDDTRWAIIGTFCRWWIKQHFAVAETLPQDIFEKLTDSQKAVMGYCSLPLKDEMAGIDIKSGFDSLHSDVREYRDRFK